jgi:hypothetical protein
METFNFEKGLILSYDQEEEIEFSNFKIKVLPVWKWIIKKGV